MREPLLGYVALDRLRELFSYVVALVYNARTLAEAAAFQQVVEEAVHSDRLRREVQAMGKTAAQALRDEGRRAEAVRSRQETLLLLLEQFNEELPAEVRAMIEGCKNVEQLDKWLRRIVGAERIEDVGIGE